MIVSRLFKRTLLFMLAAFGLIAAVLSLYSSFNLNSRMTREFESKGLAIARSVASSSVDLLLTDDAAAIQSGIDQYLEIEGVEYVIVASRHGDIIAHTFVPEVPDAIISALWDLRVRHKGRLKDKAVMEFSLGDSGDVLQVSYPVLAGEAGSVHIGMNKALIQSVIWRSTLYLQLLTLGLFLLCAGAAYKYTSAISRPLTRLTAYARRVRHGDFDALPPAHPARDEVGELTEAFRVSGQEMQALFQGMEDRIREATAEQEDALATVSAIIRNMANGLFVTGPDRTVVKYNKALAEMLRAHDENLSGTDIATVLGTEPEHLLGLRQGEAPRADAPLTAQVELTALRRDGTSFPAQVALATLFLGGTPHVVGIIHDITETRRIRDELEDAQTKLEDRVRRRTEELSRANEKLTTEIAERRSMEAALRKAEAKFRGIFENAIEGIFQLDAEGRYEDANPALARIFGHHTSEDFLRAVAEDPAAVEVDSGREQEFLDQLRNQGEVRGFESQARRKDGSVVWISRNARASRDEDGFVTGYEGFVEDITQRKEAEGRLVHQAFHDPLTGLPNRTLFQDHMRLAIERARRNKGYLFAVLYMDLDRFKIINDSLGHSVGDELLKHVARQLEAAVRSMDTVARFGGDEFAVLLEDFKHPREVIMISRRILDAVRSPARLGGYDVHTSASIGIVLQTERYKRPDLILRDADTAMYHAKEAGKSRYKVFNKRMHDQAVRLLKLETDLRRSVDAGDFALLYQPILHIETGRLAGFEALVRWVHPQRGLLAPSEFIHVAEDTGLIFQLGEWVLDEVGATVADWERRFGRNAAVNVAVNLSAKQFMQPDLDQMVGSMLARTGITPGNVHLEISESVLMDHASAAIDMLKQLKTHGVLLAMDDFGTGYSSLAYLRQFPIDAIKIDRSFVSQSDVDEEARVIVNSILSLADNLGINAVAEGVDTNQQLATLRDLGCRFAQGYLFSRPVPREEAEALIANSDMQYG